MKRFIFGMPEKMVPSRFCDGFRYVETDVNYPAANFTFKKIPSGCVLEFPIEDDCHIFGFGLQLKQFDHRGRKLRLDVNADPVDAGACSRPFFTTIGMTDESCGTVFGYCSGEPTSAHQESSEDIQVILADRAECKRILREENVAIMCAYMLMHFIADEGDPLAFLQKE